MLFLFLCLNKIISLSLSLLYGELSIVESCTIRQYRQHCKLCWNEIHPYFEEPLICINSRLILNCHYIRVGVKYSTCTWYLYLSTYLSVLAVLEYLVYGNVKVLVLVLDQRVLGNFKYYLLKSVKIANYLNTLL